MKFFPACAQTVPALTCTGFVRGITKSYKVLYLFLKNKTSYKVLYFIEGLIFFDKSYFYVLFWMWILRLQLYSVIELTPV